MYVKYIEGSCQGVIDVKINFEAQLFREITEVRAYNIQTLIGNVGGYIGLFLGFSLKEMPRALLSLLKKTHIRAKKLLS